MRFSDEFLSEVRDRNDIVDVISPYVDLRVRGALATGLCPFHNEKTPSFTVYINTQSYYCFGCGSGGDAITFIRNIENLDYTEAVTMLAERSGLALPADGSDDGVAKIVKQQDFFIKIFLHLQVKRDLIISLPEVYQWIQSGISVWGMHPMTGVRL